MRTAFLSLPLFLGLSLLPACDKTPANDILDAEPNPAVPNPGDQEYPGKSDVNQCKNNFYLRYTPCCPAGSTTGDSCDTTWVPCTLLGSNYTYCECYDGRLACGG
jgi:hypothetical protein